MAATQGAFMGQTARLRTSADQSRQRHCSVTRLFAAVLAMMLALMLGLVANFATVPAAYAENQTSETSATANTGSANKQAAASTEDEVDPNATVKVVLLCVGIPAIAGLLGYIYKSHKIKATKEARVRREEIAKRGL